jgi:GNAT superfamily N-acetyltransferase
MKAKKDNAGPTMDAIAEWLTKQLDAQLPRSEEFKCSQFRIYLRAGRRLEPEGRTFIPAITVASIDVAARLRGQGFFRTLLSWLENRAAALGYFAVFVDQVHSEILQESLPRNGYIRVASTDALEYIYWKPITPVGAVPPATTDLNMYAISDNHTNRYITALVGPDIRSSTNIQKAMLITGRKLAEEVRDSLRGPQSTRYGVVVVVMFDAERNRK